jgi:hypothetical protein
VNDLADIYGNAEDQDRGAELELRDPVTGKPTGLKMTIAGPDSDTQRRARLKMVDELAAASVEGLVSAEAREAAAIAFLARCVIRWDVQHDGTAIPLTHQAACRLFGVTWVREQVDGFASNRAAYRKGAR